MTHTPTITWCHTRTIAIPVHDTCAELADKLHTRLAGYPGKWEFCQRHGNPADELIDAAADHTANAIIVGHRGHNTLTDLLIGSVANRLVRHSPITVIVAR